MRYEAEGLSSCDVWAGRRSGGRHGGVAGRRYPIGAEVGAQEVDAHLPFAVVTESVPVVCKRGEGVDAG